MSIFRGRRAASLGIPGIVLLVIMATVGQPIFAAPGPTPRPTAPASSPTPSPLAYRNPAPTGSSILGTSPSSETRLVIYIGGGVGMAGGIVLSAVSLGSLLDQVARAGINSPTTQQGIIGTVGGLIISGIFASLIGEQLQLELP